VADFTLLKQCLDLTDERNGRPRKENKKLRADFFRINNCLAP
jgi:hypothetical protein